TFWIKQITRRLAVPGILLCPTWIYIVPVSWMIVCSLRLILRTISVLLRHKMRRCYSCCISWVCCVDSFVVLFASIIYSFWSVSFGFDNSSYLHDNIPMTLIYLQFS